MNAADQIPTLPDATPPALTRLERAVAKRLAREHGRDDQERADLHWMLLGEPKSSS